MAGGDNGGEAGKKKSRVGEITKKRWSKLHVLCGTGFLLIVFGAPGKIKTTNF